MKYRKYNPQERKVAYFSMEIGLEAEIPVYSGGLGILAGDTLKSMADLKVPAVGLTLLNEKGFLYQDIDAAGNQLETPVNWDYKGLLQPLSEKISVGIEGRDVIVQGWVYEVRGISGGTVPVIFLDTNVDANSAEDRRITSYLYGGDRRYRLMQEVVLGVGGVRLLQVLDHDQLEAYHMNEGHSALLTLELMDRYEGDLEKVRDLCVFTTHTPIAAGHDSFDLDTAKKVLGGTWDVESLRHDNIIDPNGRLNMTYLALYHSKYINGVAKKHGEITQKMFPGYNVSAITNGIHTPTWVSKPMAAVFDKHLPSWRTDPYTLRNALMIPQEDVSKAHAEAKKTLIDFVNFHYKTSMDYETLTIGFARRAAAYKRADLIFSDIKRLKQIAGKPSKIQLIFGGKAHPQDGDGKEIIKKIHSHMAEVKDTIQVAYLKNYEIFSAKLMVSGTDLWLNTPQRPMEASGTSGMKAAVNGVINFSILDGWWIEGHIEGHTGWSIGSKTAGQNPAEDSEADRKDLYEKLEKHILPTYYRKRKWWEEMMLQNIALNGSFFNTHRMVSQYVTNSYYH
ncbi:MAG: alpha-glucan family phosphorylase [Candidatus Altiarchaeota archaeon]